jgi:hypothetical protein
MAVFFDAFRRSEPVLPVTEEVRMANIAMLASTPLLRNPYSLAVGVLFQAIRGRGRAGVLDVGVGSGAQMEALLNVLRRLPHQIITWKALLERCGFRIPSIDPRVIEHAADPVHASIADQRWYVKTSSYASASPIGLLVGRRDPEHPAHAMPRGSLHH